MNEESNPKIDPELEARLVALVLGEASDFERDELHRLIEQRPELAAFMDEMKHVHGLLQDVGSGEPFAKDADWKLSDEKRNTLLAVMDGEVLPDSNTSQIVRLSEVQGLADRQPFWNMTRVAAGVCVALLSGMLLYGLTPGIYAAREVATSAMPSTADSEFSETFEMEEQANLELFDAEMPADESYAAAPPSALLGVAGNESGIVSASPKRYAAPPVAAEPAAPTPNEFGVAKQKAALSAIRDSLAVGPARTEEFLKENDEFRSLYALERQMRTPSGGPAQRRAGESKGIARLPSSPAITDSRAAGTIVRSDVVDGTITAPVAPQLPNLELGAVAQSQDAKPADGWFSATGEKAGQGKVQSGQQQSQAGAAAVAKAGRALLDFPMEQDAEAGETEAHFDDVLPGGFQGGDMDLSESNLDGLGFGGMAMGGGGDGQPPGSSGGFGGGGTGGWAYGVNGPGVDAPQNRPELGGEVAEVEKTARPNSALGDVTLAVPDVADIAGVVRGKQQRDFFQREFEGESLDGGAGEATPKYAMPVPLDGPVPDLPPEAPREYFKSKNEYEGAFADDAAMPFGEAADSIGSRAAAPDTGIKNWVDGRPAPGTANGLADGERNTRWDTENHSVNVPELAPSFRFREQHASPQPSAPPTGEAATVTRGVIINQEIESRVKKSLEKISELNERYENGDITTWERSQTYSKEEERDKDITGGATGFALENGQNQWRGYVPPMLIDSSKSMRQSKLSKRVATPEGLDEKTADKEAFSTFSLHVSDVSFKLALAALARGEWPEAAKIRIEEFVNAMDYGDPMPRQNERVACRVEQSIHPFLQQRNLLRVSMRTAAAGRASNTPLRLTLLLDNSGSMERIDRQQTVRRAFSLLAGQLKPIDQITLISFARQPRLLADKVSGAEANQLVQLISNLPSEGGTNIESALRLAFEKAREQKVDDAQNRIILLTDGAVNLGNADPESLAQMITSMREAGIAFDAAGISAEGLNDEILEALTRKGDGRYYLLDSLDAADDGFARQIAGALRPSAKNVKVQIEFNPQRVGRYKLLGFEKHRLKKEDFRNDTVDAAEMSAAEAGVAVYQFEAKPDGEGDVGSVSVRFRDLSTGQMVENCWPIPYEADAPRPDQAAPTLRIATAAAMLAAKLRGEPLGESVDLKFLAELLAGLPEQCRRVKRVEQLQTMIQQARQVSGP